jgi:long-chain acyl-CoA synthetase
MLGVWNIAAAEPTRTAVITPDGATMSYGELVTAAGRYAAGLQGLGLKAGDSVALLMPNGAPMLCLYFAAIQIGLYVVPLNWHLTAAEADHIIADCGARVLIADERFAAVAASVEAEMKFGAGFRPLAELESDEPVRERTAGAPMVYTSGTSGRPKGVKRPLTGASPDEVPPTATWFFGLFGLKPFDGHVHLCGSPLYHTAVLNFVTISLQLGHSVVLMDQWDPAEMLRLIEAHAVTHTHMVPTQFRRLLNLPGRNCYDVSSLRAAIHGAAPCPQEVKRRMLDWWGPVVIEYYAASEGGGTAITATEWRQRPGSVGKAWPGSVIKVLDGQGNEMPNGEPGQVYMQMGTSNFEYHRDAEKTRAARVGSLFTVGDIGYLDAEGYLYLCDRSSDLIISGGVNIYPAEIESELACHPSVADVAVFGIPHDDWGEQIKAVVEPLAGVEPSEALTESILEFAAQRLARFKLPRSIDYLEVMPRDPNGKLYKRRLRDPYWTGRDRQI